MSYTFYIEADRPPLFSELLTAFPQLDRNRTAKRVEENKWDAVIARARVVQIGPSNLS